jgi:large subunit ribosomal protein L15e
MYRAISKTWKDMFSQKSEEIKAKGIDLRKRHTIERLERPTRIDRARRLGYKAKPGFITIRIKVSRGGMRRSKPALGRRPKHAGIVRIKGNMSMRQTAEHRVEKKYPNLRILNSYFLYRDGRNEWYEVLLVDPENPSINKEK